MNFKWVGRNTDYAAFNITSKGETSTDLDWAVLCPALVHSVCTTNHALLDDSIQNSWLILKVKLKKMMSYWCTGCDSSLRVSRGQRLDTIPYQWTWIWSWSPTLSILRDESSVWGTSNFSLQSVDAHKHWELLRDSCEQLVDRVRKKNNTIFGNNSKRRTKLFSEKDLTWYG